VLVVVTVTAIVGLATAAVVLRDQMRCAGFEGPGIDAAELPPPVRSEGALRVASWNLRRFPIDEQADDAATGGVFEPRTNICDLEDVLAGLDADLMLLTEVCDTRRFPPILKRALPERDVAVRLSARGGAYGEHLGLAWDQGRLELVEGPLELDEVALDPSLRPALAARLRGRTQGSIDLDVIVVHLEEAPRAGPIRLEQMRAVVRWIAARDEARGQADTDLLLAGTVPAAEGTGPDGDELARLDAVLGKAGLRRIDGALGCTRYRAFGSSGGTLVAERADHVWARGLPELDEAVPVAAWLHCARARCGDLTSGPGRRDASFWDVSDHCPLTLELIDRELAPPDADEPVGNGGPRVPLGSARVVRP
jgi:hypothetical protein